MATSKRKESAALFELIDKSTLKVPKNASALKIPNWWSSKTNSASATAVAPGLPRTRSLPAVAASMAPLVKSPVGVISPPAAPTPATPQAARPAADSVATLDVPMETEPQVEAPPAQARLFDPPPPHVAPASSPSIRPPSANGHAVVMAPPSSQPADAPTDTPPEISPDLSAPLAPPDAALAQAPAEPAAILETPVRPPVETPALPAAKIPVAVADLPIVAAMMTAPALSRPVAPSSPAPSARGPAAPRVFAPQTYGQDRKAWSSPRPGAFARLPGWALLTAGAALVILICVVVLIAKTVGKTTTAPAINKTVLPTGTGPTVAIGRGNPTPPAPNPTLGARIYAGGTVHYKPELYYVIICSTRLPNTANDYALYLQKNGIDVAIETIQGNEFPYTLVATRGFASASLAKPYRDTIVHIGDTLSRGVWKDANPQKGLRGLPTGG